MLRTPAKILSGAQLAYCPIRSFITPIIEYFPRYYEEAPGLGKRTNWENHNLDYFCHSCPSDWKVKSSLKLGPVGFNQGNGENQFDKKTAKYFH